MIGNVTSIDENGATTGVGVLATYSYDNLGRRTGIAFGNGTSRTYAYDPAGRLAGLQLTFPNAAAYNQTVSGNCTYGAVSNAICYNPSSQIASITRSNDAYAWTGGYNVSRAYTTNGLNQYSTSGGVALGYDLKGNLTSSGSSSYGYNALNWLTSATGGTLGHDLTERLNTYITSSATLYFNYDGQHQILEANTSGAVVNRYVFGPGTDEPIVWYQGAGTSARSFLQADERGSIVAVSDSAGNVQNINSYDEFGIPASTNAAYASRFGYTGQAWLPEIGLYNYKARFYSPTLGRFMQTDPIGYGDGLNMYNYAHSDPINGSDPSGLDALYGTPPNSEGGGTSFTATLGIDITVFGDPCSLKLFCSTLAPDSLSIGYNSSPIKTAVSNLTNAPGEIVVVGKKKTPQSVSCTDPYVCQGVPPPQPQCNVGNNFCGAVPEIAPPKPKLCSHSVNPAGVKQSAIEGAEGGFGLKALRLLIAAGAGTLIEPGGGTVAGAAGELMGETAAGAGAGAAINYANQACGG